MTSVDEENTANENIGSGSLVKLQNVIGRAFKDVTQVFKSTDSDTFIMFEVVNSPGINIISVD